MDEINSSLHEIKLRPHNLKNNIQVNGKTQAVQNINFQEMLTDVNGKNVVQNNNVQSNISLDSLNVQSTNPEENNTNDNKAKIQDKTTTSIKTSLVLDSSTTLFSQYIPQKTIAIKDKNSAKLTRERYSPDIEKKSSLKKSVKLVKHNSERKINYQHKTDKKLLNPGKDNLKEGQLLTDNQNHPTINKKEILPANLNTESQKNFEDEQQRRKKQEHQQNEKDELNYEVEDILESYGLAKPDFPLSRIDGDNPDHTFWLRNLIFGASSEPLSYKESESVSKYIVEANKITDAEKKILKELLKEIFQHQVIKLNSDILNRLDKDAFELLYKIFPDFILDGFLKKTSLKLENKSNKKKSTETLYKIINGLKTDENEARQIIGDIEIEIGDEDKHVLINIFQGYYEKDKPNQIYKVLEFLKRNDYIIPGFIGYLQNLFIEVIENQHHETAKTVLRFLQAYSREEILLLSDTKLISTLLIKNHFDIKKINIDKSSEIMAKLIIGEKVDHLSLEVISKLSNKNLLSFLPSRIDPDMKDYLKNMPFSDNEVDKQTIGNNFENDSDNTFNFSLCGKLNLKGINDKNQEIILSFFNASLKQYFEANIKNNEFFEINLNSGNYKLEKIILIINGEKSVLNINNRTPINFVVNEFINIFYFGSLKVHINPKNLSLKKLELKNTYKELVTYYKNKYNSGLKDKIVKINPDLYKNTFK